MGQILGDGGKVEDAGARVQAASIRPARATSRPGPRWPSLAGILSLTLTGAVLRLLKALHPETGAPTPTESLDLWQTPSGVAAPMVGVVLLTVVGSPPNRAAGVPTPVWAAKGDTGAPG